MQFLARNTAVNMLLKKEIHGVNVTWYVFLTVQIIISYMCSVLTCTSGCLFHIPLDISPFIRKVLISYLSSSKEVPHLLILFPYYSYSSTSLVMTCTFRPLAT